MSWVLNSTSHNDVQTAYRIVVSSTPDFIDASGNPIAKKLLWDSGKTNTSNSSGVTYHGPHLCDASRYYWAVQTWNDKNEESPFSSISHFDTALKDDWHAKPIWVDHHTDKNIKKMTGLFFVSN